MKRKRYTFRNIYCIDSNIVNYSVLFTANIFNAIPLIFKRKSYLIRRLKADSIYCNCFFQILVVKNPEKFIILAFIHVLC